MNPAVGPVISQIDTFAFSIILMVCSALISALLTMICFWLKGLRHRMDKHENSLYRLKENLPIEYVRRDDWVRWSLKIEKKIEGVENKIDKKTDDLSKLIQKFFKGGIKES